MSLVDPEIVDISHSEMMSGCDGQQMLMTDALATPENLAHHYILVPAKLRMVTLAAFILSKCRVSWDFRRTGCLFCVVVVAH